VVVLSHTSSPTNWVSTSCALLLPAAASPNSGAFLIEPRNQVHTHIASLVLSSFGPPLPLTLPSLLLS
jgi:hypothetical protein